MCTFHSLFHTVFYMIHFAKIMLFKKKSVSLFKKLSESKTYVGRGYYLIIVSITMSIRIFDTFKNSINLG